MKAANVVVTVIAIVLTLLVVGNEAVMIDDFSNAFDGLGRTIVVVIIWAIAFACYGAISKHYSSKPN